MMIIILFAVISFCLSHVFLVRVLIPLDIGNTHVSKMAVISFRPNANRKSFTGFFITFCHLFLPTHFNSLFQFTFQFTIPPKVHNGSQLSNCEPSGTFLSLDSKSTPPRALRAPFKGQG